MPLNPMEHTSKRYDAELETVRSRVLQMGGLVETQITAAIEALSTGNLQLADQTIANDHRVNALEVQIDEDCAHIIARRQPAAQDLRMLMTVIKMITDLERIGDEAEKIARMTKLIYSAERLLLPRFGEIKAAAGDRPRDAARRRWTPSPAWTSARRPPSCRQDRLLDEQFRGIMRQLITFMMEDPRTISTSHRDPLRRQGPRADRRPLQEHVRVRGLPGEGQGRAPRHRRGVRAGDLLLRLTPPAGNEKAARGRLFLWE